MLSISQELTTSLDCRDAVSLLPDLWDSERHLCWSEMRRGLHAGGLASCLDSATDRVDIGWSRSFWGPSFPPGTG